MLTYDGLRMRVGPTSDGGLRRASSRRAAGAARSTPGCEPCATVTPTLMRERFPDIPRRVSGYNLNELLPGERLQRRAGARRVGGHLRHHPGSHARSGPQPARARARRARVSGRLSVPPTTRPRIMEHRPIGLEGFDDRLVGDMQKKRLHPDGLALLPEGGGVAAGRVRRRERSGGQRPGAVR